MLRFGTVPAAGRRLVGRGQARRGELCAKQLQGSGGLGADPALPLKTRPPTQPMQRSRPTPVDLDQQRRQLSGRVAAVPARRRVEVHVRGRAARRFEFDGAGGGQVSGVQLSHGAVRMRVRVLGDLASTTLSSHGRAAQRSGCASGRSHWRHGPPKRAGNSTPDQIKHAKEQTKAPSLKTKPRPARRCWP